MESGPKQYRVKRGACACSALLVAMLATSPACPADCEIWMSSAHASPGETVLLRLQMRSDLPIVGFTVVLEADVELKIDADAIEAQPPGCVESFALWDTPENNGCVAMGAIVDLSPADCSYEAGIWHTVALLPVAVDTAAVVGDTLCVHFADTCGTPPKVNEIVLRMPTPPATAIACEPKVVQEGCVLVGDTPLPPRIVSGIAESCNVSLSWENREDYDEVVIYRNGEQAIRLPGPHNAGIEVKYEEPNVPSGVHTYCVSGIAGGAESTVSCIDVQIEVSCTAVHIGDANCDGAVNIADAICLLAYLFGLPSAPCKNPCCLAAMDANGDRRTDVADAIKILSFLFAQETMVGPDGSGIAAQKDGCILYLGELVTLPCATPCP